MTDDKSLTIKQRRWLKEYLISGSARDAALKTYDCTEDSAGVIGHENLQKLNVAGAMEDAGLTTKMLFDKHKEGLEATRTVSAVKTSKEAGADSTDFIDVPDYAVRHKYLETAYKVKKILVDKQGEVTIPIQIVFNLDEIIGLSHTPAETADSDAGAIQPTV